ncbi:hypothetical protein [Streptomyces indicus]|uniref:Sporulation protein YtfJ (Spore_YtfJ) n=1 Tax=Streptomyces indicus TaxID=417292 RepID=A0A1G9CB95_9ACTN|nr:hypothetical protein [Streptomyces indicus]SDK48952.1 hypothetical protein SAMN05421806_10843 [Streptomyces indicus]
MTRSNEIAPQGGGESQVALPDRVYELAPAPGRGRVSAFGEAVTRDGVTVIPVAEIFDFGGATGPDGQGQGRGQGQGSGPGAGAMSGAHPIGYIEIRNGTATYHPLRTPWQRVALPLAALAAGAAVPALVRWLGRWSR